MTPIEAAIRAGYEADPCRFPPPSAVDGEVVGWRAGITAALDAAEDDITNALSKAWVGATVGDMVQEIRRVMLERSDR